LSGFVVDLVVAAFVGHAIWRGWRRGLIRGAAKFLGLVVASAAAALLHEPGALVARAFGASDRHDDLVGAVLVFGGVVLGFHFVGNALARAFRTTRIGSLVDGGGGAAFAGIWALALTVLALTSMTLFPTSNAAAAVRDSTLGRGIVDIAPEVARAAAGADLRAWLADMLGPNEDARDPTA